MGAKALTPTYLTLRVSPCPLDCFFPGCLLCHPQPRWHLSAGKGPLQEEALHSSHDAFTPPTGGRGSGLRVPCSPSEGRGEGLVPPDLPRRTRDEDT